jgi:hypothetical protein
MYRVIASQTKRYINPDSAEGLRITKDIEAANTIMGNVRLQCKDARKQRARKAKQSTAQPETLVSESPMQPASSSRKTKQASTIQSQSTHAVSTRDINAGTIAPAVLLQSKITRSTSKTIVGPPVPTIAPAVVSQRTTRRISNTNVAIPVALDSGISRGLSMITAVIVQFTPISITTRHSYPKTPETTPVITASGSEVSETTRTATVLVKSNILSTGWWIAFCRPLVSLSSPFCHPFVSPFTVVTI